MIFNGSQPNTYGVDKVSNPYQDGNLLEILEKVVLAISKHILLLLIVMVQSV